MKHYSYATSLTMPVYNFADHWDAFDNAEPLFNLGQWMRARGVSTFERVDAVDENKQGTRQQKA
jgi:hypothetical protein